MLCIINYVKIEMERRKNVFEKSKCQVSYSFYQKNADHVGIVYKICNTYVKE